MWMENLSEINDDHEDDNQKQEFEHEKGRDSEQPRDFATPRSQANLF
jgi:hypothetical protein